jgi:hypothetical protein
LSKIKEGSGTLLDHSMILYGSPFADGHKHASKQLPIIIAGNGGGKLKPGRHITHKSGQLEGIYISMLDIMGLKVEQIGGTKKALSIT